MTRTLVEIDGSSRSGSGAIVRQAVAYAALTRTPIHVSNARALRRDPGLRRQHVRVIEAMADVVGATTNGVHVGSREFGFEPQIRDIAPAYAWDIGTAGSTTMLAIAVLPVLAFSPQRVSVEITGGLFQDFAPTAYHVQHALLPILRAMGVRATWEIVRPGYVPTGGGVIRLTVDPVDHTLASIRLERAGPVRRIWGIALASHLRDRNVAKRMSDAAGNVLRAAGHAASIDIVEDTSALQCGAALALFADRDGGVRIGADRAGAPGRPAERIGRDVAGRLLADLATDATVDAHVADQIIPFAAMATGNTIVRIPRRTEHIESGAWLAGEFLGAEVTVSDGVLAVRGVGYAPE